ncbi:SCO-spondin isoform X4 [Onychostoma macrolepis]|uniref:SCO-spondin isoform X4 n=1 Tax=Onychostoma macrolepis TaxID=369639 RepID=UPI002729A389|nr:SCO-spondin isoform X4 [Onychostoma macrolepis]
MLRVMVCPPGFLCSQGLDREPQRSAVFCPIGFYCPGGSVDPNPVPCPKGTYSRQPGLRDPSDCTKCPEGKYCYTENPQEEPIIEPTGNCPDGYFCPPGTGHPNSFPCQSGFFRNDSYGHGGEACVECPPSYYCPTLATHTPTVCPQGFYCTEGSSAPEPCEEGTFGSWPALSKVSQCAPCSGGKYCTGLGKSEATGDCEGGFYCRQGSTSPVPPDGHEGGVCPAGSFCPPGSVHPQPCPSGTYSNSTGLQHAEKCVHCPPGYYCLGTNSTSPSGPCFAGYYCTGGSATPVQHEAEEGHYSLEGAVRAEPCPLGNFQPGRGYNSCIECQSGRLCNKTGLSQQPLCPPGHFCPAGSLIAHPCPPGTYTASSGAEDLQHCGPCDAGQYCHSPGLTAPQGPCEPGFYCTGGSHVATPISSRFGDICPMGYYCPAGTRHPHEYPCPPGTWSNALGAQNVSSCWLCPAGFFCNSSGLTQPTGICAPGFYCAGGAKTAMPDDGVTGNRCPTRYYCPQGCTSPLHCPDGTHSNSTGAAECSDCPTGWLCLEGEELQLCPEGHYCLGGTVEDILPCPPGTYSPKAGQNQVEQCLLCSAGMYCEDWGLVEPTGPCQAGYFCLTGINFKNPDANISTGVGGPCPVGHYCPEGTSLPLPCPLGTFSNSLYVTENTRCSLCPAGEFCGSVGLSRPSGLCREGFYCPAGASSSTGSDSEGGLCPQAHFCPTGSAVPVPCPAGTYTNLTGQIKCTPCHAGYYCPESTSKYTMYPCPPGFYCPDGTKHATQFPCPRGYYNPEPMTHSLDSCLPCPPGHYCEKEHLSTVSGKCKAGWFCVSAAWNAQPFDLDNYTNANCLCPASSTGGRCQEGFYCPTGTSEPVSCPPGAFCNATGLALPSGPCSPGYYCTKEATSSRPTDGITGNICPPGTYCDEGSSAPQPCPAGTFSPAAGLVSKDECQPCRAGYYCATPGLQAPTAPCRQGYWCPAGQTDDLALPCLVGHYCPPGSPVPILCPTGTYQDKQKQANCTICESGFYCDETFGAANISVLQPCPKGHYCPKGTGYAEQFPCPAGTYNPRELMDSQNDCLLCPSGHYCPDVGLEEPAGLCLAGFWCREGSHSPSHLDGPTGTVCPVGHYCPKGTDSPVPCPVGTWSNSTGLRSAEECQSCPGGFYCASTGLTEPSGLCSNGFYCAKKAETPTPIDGVSGHICPEGHYCPSGTTLPVPCDPGTFVTVTQASQCWPCTAGWYCVDGARLLCPAGFYCPEGTGYDWKPCPVGTYSSDSGLSVLSECKECDGGHYCSLQNSTSVTGKCSEGYYCAHGNISPQPHKQSAGGGSCPVGHFCPQGTAQPQPCPEGTFSYKTQLVKMEECLSCPAGHYCDISGLTSPSGECWEGFYCKQGAVLPNSPISDHRGGPCPTGYFCSRGSGAPQACPEGSISSRERQASCSLCPQGYYCPANGSFSEGIECPVGHYCPTGTHLQNQHPCPAGTINPHTRMSSREDCLPCPPGFFCESPGQSDVSGPCAAGHFCLSGAVSPTPVDGGTGGRCPQGHYCPVGSSSPETCPEGYYSNSSRNTKLSDCVPCPPGFACSSRGLSSPSHVCQMGYYCPQGQNSSHPAHFICSPGHMCPPGSPAQIPCPIGTYQNLQGQVECSVCPAGYFCAGSDTVTGGTSIPVSCPRGYYCPPGSESGVSFPCPAGTFNGQLGLSSKDQCISCPPGKYCSSSGLDTPTGNCSPGYVCNQSASLSEPVGDSTGGRCTAGFYCPAGASHMEPCPLGTFGSLEGAASVEMCQSCTPGQYCAEPGLSSPSGPCSPGYYCIQRSHTSTPQNYNNTDCEEPGAHTMEDVYSQIQFFGDVCPAGHYCPIGSARPEPCPPGSFLGQRGAVSETDCHPCTPGFYCPDWGQSSAELRCPEGSFCPAGSVTGHQPDRQCPYGHACPYGSVQPAICLPGTYQPLPSQPSCKPCPPGFYCLEGCTTPFPCPAGSASMIEGLQSQLDCSPCPPGFYCNTSALISPTGPCSAGHFCSSGATEPAPVSQMYGDICPAGHYCPEQSSAPLPCPVGFILQDKGATSSNDCSPCPPSRYCVAPGSSQPSGFCAPGHYCIGSADTAAPQASPSQQTCFCDLIPSSHLQMYDLCFLKHNITCSIHISGDGAGVWTDLDPLLDLTESEGYSESPLQITETCTGFKGDLCPKGSYCPVGSSLPQPCDSGSYCNQTGLHTPAGLCFTGFFCPTGSLNPSAMPCPPGHLCPRGTPLPLPCPQGTVRSSTGGSIADDCLECPPGYFCERRGLTKPSGLCSEGYYCPGGQDTSRPPEHVCGAGHFCESGSITERPCFPGSFQPSLGQHRCEVCPARFFCPENGMTHPLPCQPGFYCPVGASNQHPCPPGSYGNLSGLAESSECSQCDPGTYCMGSGNVSPTGSCSAGFLCFGGAIIPSPNDNETGIPCPTGSYCPAGSFAGIPCPKGTFSNQRQLSDISQCQNCTPGFYCSEPGLTTVSGPCLPGFYCSEGSPTSAPMSAVYGDICPPGHYCEIGSAVPTPCPVGSRRPHSGGKGTDDCMPCPGGQFQDQKGQSECKPCPPGFHCVNLTRGFMGVSTPLVCPEGFYCPNETQSGNPVPCPKGTYSDSLGLISAEQCLVCPMGHFCGSYGLSEPSGPCAPGFLCFVQATVPNPTDNSTGTLCPPGAYCLLGTRAGECSAGYYCDWGSSSPEQSLCPAGFYCPAGTHKPLACTAGTYSSVMGNSHRENCEPCPLGYYCQGEAVAELLPCPPGHFCPTGTSQGTQFPCPPGTVQPQSGTASIDECLQCPAGMFCARHGLSEPTGRCQDGFHCPSGATSPNGTGNVIESTGNSMCPPGHYCPTGISSPLPCPAGTFSSSPGLSGAEQCQLCPPGYFCEQTAMVHPSEAALCDAGYVCINGSRSARPVDGLQGYICPSGHSCPIGTPLEVPCEPGTYSKAPGATHCLSCPAGTMCPSPGTQEPSPCPMGHFCPVGTAAAVPCPVGTLGQATRAQSKAACVPCPTGLYCSSPGTSQPQGQCQQGYFCQGGSPNPAPLNTTGYLRNGPCPQGHFCPSGTLMPLPCPAGSIRDLTGGYSIESCLPCPAGHYCASEGLDAPTGPCAAGFYCPVDFSSTTPHAFLCPKGHYCPLGSALALPCPTGQYQPNPGSDNCIPCRPGYYCEEAIIGDPRPCPPHSYCPAATMVPQPCPNGTYTPPEVGGLQEERECLPCPPGKFCKAGQVKGLCAAGFLCISGSSEFTPQSAFLLNRDQCEWGAQCAGPCPVGFYCPEGTKEPLSCPANTIRAISGASTIHDCLPCPPRHWCQEGDPIPRMCPPGYYCDGIADYESAGRPGPRECPLFTYRPTSGAGSKGDCLICPPGTFCNSTGLTDFSSFLCPPGHWCGGTGFPVPCPAGTMRAQPGAAAVSLCEPCPPGTYCPDPRTMGQPNTAGIPCRASYECPAGSVTETPCRAGSYCRPQTGDPTPCPAGYYCPEGSHTYSSPQQVCTFPYYCPANSSTMLSCPDGWMPLNTSGLRKSQESSCVLCGAGTYRPSRSPHLQCLLCPPGHHCPLGSHHYSVQPCPVGYFCPQGSSDPVPCPPGSYGNHTSAESLEECNKCPPGTFNHLHAQRACLPCGSSSTSDAGASSCTCLGKNRAFQYSDGSCLCKSGFVFYNELDFKSSTADSELDCQPEVKKRCGAGQVRLASTLECVFPSTYSCNVTCGPQGGTLDVGMGICHCDRYVSVEELCNSSCVSTLPVLSARLDTDGQLLLRIKAADESKTWSRNMINVLGPDVHVKNIGKIHFIQFAPEGVFGWILKDPLLIDSLVREPVEILERDFRKKRHADQNEVSEPLPRIPNPIACLSPNDMLIFQLTINHTDRHYSHFPVYQKDHLFSSNPGWDFGAFRRLQHLVKHTQLNSSKFAHVFMEPGKYVFLDNAVPDWSLIVVVSEQGSECNPTTAAFHPTTPAQLVRHGIVKQHSLNLLPDWGLITGILSLLVLLIIVLTASALVLRPNRSNLIAQGRPKPKWRSLGEPSLPIEYVYNTESVDSSEPLGLRGVGEGAESEEPAVCKGGFRTTLMELEEFNVKTLYDKLEDQNLHLASQLAKHRKDTQEFYRNMCQQIDALRDTLENMEPSELNQLKKILDNDVLMKRETAHEPWMGLMEAVLRSLEGVLCRMNGEVWQPQDSTATNSHRDTRESELHTGFTQFSPADMSEFKVRAETEAASSDQGQQQSTIPCVSEEELAKFVSLTPLSKTLQEIKESLQTLTHASKTEDVIISPAEGEPSHLIPVALDSLSPQHFTVFLFGCHIVRLLSRACSFPPVMLLLAGTVPVSHCDNLLAYCHKDFYYDTANQILYILEKKLQNAGQFISILLHSMAYITSGSKPLEFIKAFHLAISELSMQLFHHSFTEDQRKGKMNEENTPEAFGTLVEDFFSVKIPTETHFTEHLLAERLQVYKYFKLEQLLQELKPTRKDRHGYGRGQSGLKTQVPVLCMEREINRLDEVYQQLSSELHRETLIRSPPEKKEPRFDKPLQEKQVMLELQKCTVDQRLKEMRDRLSKLSLSPNENRPAHGTVLAQEDSQTPSKRKPDSGGAEKQTPAAGQSSKKKKQSKHMDKDEEKGVTA